MQILMAGSVWKKKSTFLTGIFVALLIWMVVYILISTVRSTWVKNRRTSLLNKHFTAANWSNKKMGISAKMKKGKDTHFRENFFEWQDGKSVMEPNIGADYVTNASKYFIYRCDMKSMSFCGGWGDRIKGIIAAYLIANLTGRVFKIELRNPPCEITEIIVPNMVNWSLPAPFHEKVTKATPGIIRVNAVSNSTFFSYIQFINFTEWLGLDADYVYFKGNAHGIREFRKSKIYKQQLSWMADLTNSQIFAAIFKRLFKLSNRLNKKIKAFLELMIPTANHKLVCAHVRVGRNPSNPLDNVVRTPENELPIIWNFLNAHSKTDIQPVFLMSDSETVISEAKKQNFSQRLFVTDGAIVHVDRFYDVQNDELCTGLEKVIFDQHVLMNCDILMLSKSSLSKAAAIIRGENHGLYLFRRGGNVIPCKLSSFYR